MSIIIDLSVVSTVAIFFDFISERRVFVEASAKIVALKMNPMAKT